ncbi:metal ABC transporter ATP-binding protein [uncultured Amnibacterium sp.]|uniref:metal ABC transporter ATP-binding protein n=1 Tax=uncultured Amnibacterium sp. TaxID=1631851 RepID=UPI0035C9F2FA
MTARAAAPLVLTDAAVARGGRTLWAGLSLTVEAGEFLAVLGPNGTGKTTLLQAALGLLPLAAGRVTVAGRPARRGNSDVGYIPQQKGFDADLGARGRDLVALGLDGFRYGPRRHPQAMRRRVDEAIESVGATAYADAPIGRLSGGEQQRLRVAQALLSDPGLLLCDEPLLSLDLANQRSITALIDRRRREARTAVVFVTHEINPVLQYVTRVLYLVEGRWAIGTPDEVITDETLSDLYRTEVQVIRHRGSLLITGTGESHRNLPFEEHHH